MDLGRHKLTIVDAPNKNNRVYPSSMVTEAIGKAPELFGQIGMVFNNQIELDKVSHVVTEMQIEEIDGQSFLTGKVTIMSTDQGKILKTLSEVGEVHFRPAGVGTPVKQPDGTVLVTDWIPTSINMVQDPA